MFVTGGPSLLRGAPERIHATLRPILSPEVPLYINRARDPQADAWKGMADYSRTDGFSRTGILKAEYEEWGGDRIKKWWGGNWNMAT